MVGIGSAWRSRWKECKGKFAGWESWVWRNEWGVVGMVRIVLSEHALVLHVYWRPISLNIEFWGGSLFLLLVLTWVFGPEVIVVKWGRVPLLKAHSSVCQVWVQVLVIELMRKNTKALIASVWSCKSESVRREAGLSTVTHSATPVKAHIS